MAQACPDSSRSGRHQRSTGLGPPAGSSQPVHAAPRRAAPREAVQRACGRPPLPAPPLVAAPAQFFPARPGRPETPARCRCRHRPPWRVCRAALRRVAPGPATARSFWSEHASCLHPWAVTGLHEEFRGLNEKLLVTGVRDGESLEGLLRWACDGRGGGAQLGVLRRPGGLSPKS